MLLMHNSFLFSFFLLSVSNTILYILYVGPNSWWGTQHICCRDICLVPRKEVPSIYAGYLTERWAPSTPITHADWLPIRNEEMLKKVKDKLINRACLLQRGWTHGAGHLTDICIYRLKRDGYRNGIHDRYLFLNLYNFLQKNQSHVADDLSASE